MWSTIGNMLFVWHAGTASSLSVTDSTGNATGTNHSSTATAGQIAGGAAMTTSQYIDWGNPANMSNVDYNKAWTISMWASWTTSGNSNMFSKQNNGGNFPGWGLGTFSGKMEVFVYNSGGFVIDWPSADNDGTLRRYDLSYSGGNTTGAFSGFTNATSKSLTARANASLGSTVTSSAAMQLNGRGGANNTIAFTGDEVRVRSTNDSANRIATDYAIQTSTTMVTVGTPVSVGGSGGPWPWFLDPTLSGGMHVMGI